jgi:transcriptional regulator with GAF, ATPase, and Fis domain
MVMMRDNREVTRYIISTAIRITGAERGAIFLMESDAGILQPLLRAGNNITENDIAHSNFQESMKMIHNVFTTEKGLIHNKDSDTSQNTFKNRSIRDCICIPIKIRGSVVGVLYLDNYFFSNILKKVDIEILNYFAGQAAIAMDNAKAYEEIRFLNETLKQENQYYEEQQIEELNFEEIVGESKAIKEVLSKVKQVYETDSNVLILGETGVGKELVARAIHRLGLRKDKPFIRVNCSNFPDSLISSELFGHEKGSFTGAMEQRIGRFELADKGTIFLDEMGEISKNVQVRLLRVLQSKEFERIGGKRTIYSDFRLISATNKDLYNEVKQGFFREDLYYRLNVFPVHVPPLRERKEDIPLLAHYFLRIYGKKLSKPVKKISNSNMDKLMKYHWPGNVRELENIIERGTILSSGKWFQVPELILDFNEDPYENETTSLEEIEKRHIISVLKTTSGVIQGKNAAAELLGIHPNTLHSKIKKLGIRKNVFYKSALEEVPYDIIPTVR